MSSEARLQISLQVKKGSKVYQSQPTAFIADVGGNNGPVPGTVLCTRQGTNIDLSQLTTPGGLCRIMNLDSANWVEVGIYEPATFEFYPLMELLPGESYIVRLSRKLGSELGTGTGSGTLESGLKLRVKANNASCIVLVEAFDA